MKKSAEKLELTYGYVEGIQGKVLTDATVTLSWSGDFADASDIYYRVYISGDQNFGTYEVFETAKDATSLTFSSGDFKNPVGIFEILANNGNKVYWYVQAVDAHGNAADNVSSLRHQLSSAGRAGHLGAYNHAFRLCRFFDFVGNGRLLVRHHRNGAERSRHKLRIYVSIFQYGLFRTREHLFRAGNADNLLPHRHAYHQAEKVAEAEGRG